MKAEPYIGEHIKGDADPSTTILICRLVTYLQPKHILEVGTWRGKTAYNMALHSPPGARVITIDLPSEMLTGNELAWGTDAVYFQPRDKIGVVYKGTPMEVKINQIFADSTTPGCRQLLDDLLRGEKLDFAFIDGSHQYDSLRTNFEELVLPRMAEGGVALVDDYNYTATHVSVVEFIATKARTQGYAFYWYAPLDERSTHCVIFPNISEAKNRDYRK